MGRRLTAGGPHYYRLGAESDIGGEIYERMLLERLPAHGVDLVIGLPRDQLVVSPPEGWHVDVLRHGRGLHWTRAPLVFVPYVLGLLRAGRVDLLRGHSVRHVGPSLLMARAMARSPVPVVLHQHHLTERWAKLEAAIVKRADAVITVSEHSRRELAASGVAPERIHVVYEGVARPPQTAGLPDAWPAGHGMRLLYLGRLEPRKRPGVALEALASLRRSGVEASLVVAGDGELAAALAREATALGIADDVRFLGRVPEEDKWRLYDTAHAVLFPSTLEGFGLVVAEAQSRGVPVIAAAATATAEALDPGRSGLLATSDGDAFAAGLLEMADESRRQAMVARAREFAQRFDWDACAESVADVYADVVAGGRR